MPTTHPPANAWRFPITAFAQMGEPEADTGSEEYSVSIPLPDRECQGVPATGQTECFDLVGPINCTGTGQDGEYQNGLTTGAFPRFTDNGDGTVTDNLTALILLQDANCFPPFHDWLTALSLSNTLADGSCGLTDGSVAGDWRLPNVKELQSLIDYGNSAPALPAGHPFFGLSNHYWSSTTSALGPQAARDASFFAGNSNSNYKGGNRAVWPVRGGQ